jgi:hypothetical protein
MILPFISNTTFGGWKEAQNATILTLLGLKV